jgi:hypothetical protein
MEMLHAARKKPCGNAFVHCLAGTCTSFIPPVPKKHLPRRKAEHTGFEPHQVEPRYHAATFPIAAILARKASARTTHMYKVR